MRRRIHAGRWQLVHRAIVVNFNGPLPRDLAIRAALLAAGQGATISHDTAAELAKLTDEPAAKIHVTVPWPRRVLPLAGVTVHVSRRLDLTRHPALTPFQTRVEATIFDLADASGSAERAVGWAVAACGRRLTTPLRLAEFLRRRGRTRWRQEWMSALDDLSNGAESVLELRYLRDVERAHRLPTARRQAVHARLGGRIFDDVRYDDFGVVVELDGRIAHGDETTLRDLRRDNIAAMRGDLVLHFGWEDVTATPCHVAAQVAAVLQSRGWIGQPRRCRRPGCEIAAR